MTSYTMQKFSRTREIVLGCVLLGGVGFADSKSYQPAAGDVAWRTWATREEIAPLTQRDTQVFRSAPESLYISGNGNAAAHGGWVYPVTEVEAGRWYRFSAFLKTEGIDSPRLQSVARLDWRTVEGKTAGRPDYPFERSAVGDWVQLTLDVPAPEKAESVEIQLYLANAANGKIWWDGVSFDEIETPLPRTVKVSTINLQPRRTGSARESVSRFLNVVHSEVETDADIILLPEAITLVGTGLKYVDVAETIPGPTTERLAKAARAKSSYLVAGLLERDGPAVYNTAVLLDREGKLAGKYRKVYLPREEIEGGVTPGNEYPVFKTDFGTVGMMICWDAQYADPARALALRGAELLLVPIWGGNEVLGKARAIENHVFMATAGYGYPTYVMDPMGETLAIASEEGQVATATIDLNRRYTDDWLGWMRGRFMHELRTDVAVEPR
jgi:predicted amidohydrolase